MPSPGSVRTLTLLNNKLFLVSDKKHLSTEPWFYTALTTMNTEAIVGCPFYNSSLNLCSFFSLVPMCSCGNYSCLKTKYWDASLTIVIYVHKCLPLGLFVSSMCSKFSLVELLGTKVFPAFSRLWFTWDQLCSGILTRDLNIVLPKQKDIRLIYALGLSTPISACQWSVQSDFNCGLPICTSVLLAYSVTGLYLV